MNGAPSRCDRSWKTPTLEFTSGACSSGVSVAREPQIGRHEELISAGSRRFLRAGRAGSGCNSGHSNDKARQHPAGGPARAGDRLDALGHRFPPPLAAGERALALLMCLAPRIRSSLLQPGLEETFFAGFRKLGEMFLHAGLDPALAGRDLAAETSDVGLARLEYPPRARPHLCHRPR